MPYKDKAKQREYQRKRAARLRKEWFKGKSCANCGCRKNLELDHIYPQQKVSHKIWSWSAKRRQEELAKCQALCASCHRVKTGIENSKMLIHGTRGAYRKGCRCKSCKASQRMYQRLWRASKGIGKPVIVE